MPLATVQNYLQSQLNGLALPLGLGNLTAAIQPSPPIDVPGATAYIWGASGDESRSSPGTFPRAQHGDLATGGNKMLTHRPSIWLVWCTDGDQPLATLSLNFPAIIDFVLATLRNVEMLDVTQHAPDPVTGRLSNLLNIGENMSWEYAPVRFLADQRGLRFDALLTVEVIEVIQA